MRFTEQAGSLIPARLRKSTKPAFLVIQFVDMDLLDVLLENPSGCVRGLYGTGHD